MRLELTCWCCDVGDITWLVALLLLQPPLLLLPFCWEITLGLIPPPINWLNCRELAALIVTEVGSLSFTRPVAGIDPATQNWVLKRACSFKWYRVSSNFQGHPVVAALLTLMNVGLRHWSIIAVPSWTGGAAIQRNMAKAVNNHAVHQIHRLWKSKEKAF